MVILSFANALGCNLYNIDEFNQIPFPEFTDINKYDEYKYQYLTSKISEDKLSKNIILDYILQLESSA